MSRRPLEVPAVERAVLGAILRDPGMYWNERARLPARLFAQPINNRVMKIIHQLADKNREFSAPAVIARMAAGNEDDEISPEGYIAALLADDTANTPGLDLIEDLVDAWARREMGRVGERLIKASVEDSDTPAIERLERAIDRAASIGEMLVDAGDDPDRAITEMLNEASAAYSRRGTDGIPWFLREVFQVVGSELEYGWLIGDMADSGGGKTSFALQQAYHAAKQGTPVPLLSGDQAPKDCYRQMAAQVLGIETGSIRTGKQSTAELDRLIEFSRVELSRLPIYVRKTARPKTTEIAASVRRFKRERGRGLVIVDHAGKITAEHPSTDAGVRYNQIFADMKDLAASADCAMLILMQRNAKAGERDNARPIDTDIPGGPGVRQNFDALFATYFEDRWLKQKLRIARENQREQLEGRIQRCIGKAELIGMKSRFAQEGVDAKVKWVPRFTRYQSFVAEAQAEAPDLLDDGFYGRAA